MVWIIKIMYSFRVLMQWTRLLLAVFDIPKWLHILILTLSITLLHFIVVYIIQSLIKPLIFLHTQNIFSCKFSSCWNAKPLLINEYVISLLLFLVSFVLPEIKCISESLSYHYRHLLSIRVVMEFMVSWLPVTIIMLTSTTTLLINEFSNITTAIFTTINYAFQLLAVKPPKPIFSILNHQNFGTDQYLKKKYISYLIVCDMWSYGIFK